MEKNTRLRIHWLEVALVLLPFAAVAVLWPGFRILVGQRQSDAGPTIRCARLLAKQQRGV